MSARFALVSHLLLCGAGSLAASAAVAQNTAIVKPHIPAEAKRMTVDVSNGALSVKGEPLKTTAALQIRDMQNRLKLTQSLSGRYAAAVLFDANGAATRIWLLGQ